jgi:uncharacterized protein YcbX
MNIASIWRYPVKSLAGEQLSQVRIGADGVDGDRLVRVCGPEGVRTARRHHRLLGLHGTIGADGRAWIDGHPWTSDAALARVREAAGDDAWLEAAPVDERFDVLPLLIATDGAIAAFGRDVRRLRTNIVIGGVEGLQEFEWPGHELQIGSVRILIDSRRPRCPMTTVDPDTTEVDPAVLKDIGRRFGGRLALNAEVVRGGTIKVGDGVAIE